MASWKERFTVNSKAVVKHEVNGQQVRFYPNRMGLLGELAEMSKPIATALAALLGEGRTDATSVVEVFRDKPKKDKAGVESAESSVEKTTVEAVSPEVADHRRKERAQAVSDLIDGLTNERSQRMLGALLMDSMRDEFPYKKERPIADVEEFLFGDNEKYYGIDAPVLVELTTGWLKANAKVFGGMGEKVAALVRGRLGILQSLPIEETTTAADGSSSKTPSSPPSDSDSPSST